MSLRIDVADLLAHPSARRPYAGREVVAGLAGSAASVPEGEPVVLDLVLERIPDGIVVRGRLATAWRAQCSVCLAELKRPLELPVSELFEPEPLEGETYPLQGHEIDLTQLVRDVIVLELPAAPVCADGGREPCADPPPRPVEDDAPDPRWAALSELQLDQAER